MKSFHHRVAVLGAAMGLGTTLAGASGTVVQINDGATPGNCVFGVAAIGWMWTAPTSFVWDGLGSIFKTCCQFNVLSPSQATLLIATNTPANGGTTPYAGAVDGVANSIFAGIAVTAGNSYLIGYSNLTSNPPFAMGVNIVNCVPDQPLGTVNLSGWYTANNFASFIPASVVGGVQQQPLPSPHPCS